MMRSILVGIAVLMALSIGWLSFEWYGSRHSGEAYGAPFTLVDQYGHAITRADFIGHPTALYFGYTNCPDVCPTTLADLAMWLKTLGPDGEDIRAYFVTIDPDRDTPKIMNEYVSNLSRRIVGISGAPDKVRAMARAYGIYFRKVDGKDGGYSMDHTASILLLGRRGALVGTIAFGESAKSAEAKLRRLEAGA